MSTGDLALGVLEEKRSHPMKNPNGPLGQSRRVPIRIVAETTRLRTVKRDAGITLETGIQPNRITPTTDTSKNGNGQSAGHFQYLPSRF